MRSSFLLSALILTVCYTTAHSQMSQPFVVDSLVNAYSLYGTGHTPFVYTPSDGDGYFTIIKRGGVVGSSTEGSNNLFIISSQDDGASWTTPIGSLNSQLEYPAPRYPGVVVLGSNASSAAELEYVFHFPYHNGGGADPWEGQVLGQANSQFSGSDKWFTTTAERPIYNGKEMILSTYCELVASPDASKSLMAGNFIVGDAELPEQANAIGIVRFDVTKDQFPIVSIPWDISEFNADNVSFAETNTQIGLVIDENEKSYLMVNARLATRETSMPAGYTSFNGPILTTTSDYGENWSTWDPMPIELFSQFMDEHAPEAGEWSKATSFFGFNQTELVLIKPNHVAGICTAVLANDDQSEFAVYFVEVEWNDGNWSLRAITEESFSPNMRNEFGSTALSASQKRNELEIAVTEDGEYLVAKWLGFNNNSDNTSDIYLSYRKVDGGEWSMPVNSTQTELIVKCSYMPKVVPSIMTVPLIRAVSIPQLGETDSDEVQTDIWHPQHIVMWFGDATGGASSIGNSNAIDFNASFAPHPIQHVSHVSAEVPRAMNGNVEIWSTQGELLKTIFSGQVQAGLNEWKIHANGLASGTYVLRLTDNQNVLQTTFVISK